MKKDLMFFTDPHIGKVLVSNTTPASRKRLTARLTESAVEQTNSQKNKGGQSVCGGDLFDKFDNPASVVRDGIRVASKCALVLGGNHDVENSAGSYSSLNLVDDTLNSDLCSPVVMPTYNEKSCHRTTVKGVRIDSVPHHSTQQLFDETLKSLLENPKSTVPMVLLLHCNYDCDMATNDTSLNLTRDVAAQLLNTYDYILIGHDHNPKKDFDGRLIVMGSIHPTCFGDCHVDHKIYGFSVGDDSITEEVVWSAADKYAEYETDDDISLWEPLPEGYEFVRVTGQMTPEQVPQLAKWVRDAWKRESVFAIRVDAVVVAERSEADGGNCGQRLSFRDTLSRKLADSPELRDVWEMVTGEMGDAE